MSSDCSVSGTQRGGQSERAAFWPRCSSGATVMKSRDRPRTGRCRRRGWCAAPADDVDSRGVLEADHHVAHRPVTDVDHGAGDGDHRLAGRGDDLRGHLVDADLDERRCAGLARGGAWRDGASTGIATRSPRRTEPQCRIAATSPADELPRARRASPRSALAASDRSRPWTATVRPAAPGSSGRRFAGAGVGLRPAPRRGGRQRRQRGRAVGRAACRSARRRPRPVGVRRRRPAATAAPRSAPTPPRRPRRRRRTARRPRNRIK